jgi:Flp pilus assembly protein TadG
MRRSLKHLRCARHGGPALRDGRFERGQVAAEFAIVSLFLAALFAGMIDVSRAWRASEALAAAVRDGARLAAIAPADRRVSAAEELVRMSAALYFEAGDVEIDVDDLLIDVSDGSTGGSQGVPIVTVSATANIPLQYGNLLPFGSTVDGQRVLSVSRTASFRNEVAAEENGAPGNGGGGGGSGGGGSGGGGNGGGGNGGGGNGK